MQPGTRTTTRPLTSGASAWPPLPSSPSGTRRPTSQRTKAAVIAASTLAPAIPASPATPALVWFRSDLRIRDNPALWQATTTASTPVVALYVVSPQEWKRHDLAPIRVAFMLQHVQQLKLHLARLHIPLVVVHASHGRDVPALVGDVVTRLGARSLHYNQEYEADEMVRDAKVGTLLAQASPSTTIHAWQDQIILPPKMVRTREGKANTVFTPFKRRWMEMAVNNPRYLNVHPVPEAQVPPSWSADVRAYLLQCAKVPEFIPGFEMSPAHQEALATWRVGEEAAADILQTFLAERSQEYKTARNFPGIHGTSKLSPYLAIGVISSKTCLSAAQQANHGKLESGSAGLVHWISELLWREFFRCILIEFPRVGRSRAFQLDTERVAWSYDRTAFQQWCEGRTGYPIVDAAMRQLRQDGWMHNRLRMIAAMFLTKDLLIDWRWGEKYFMEQQIDGDFATNNGGWQWSASTGTDSQPYFRIFNPLLQAQKFDEDGSFIRKYVPELRGLKLAKNVHDPHGTLDPQAFARLGYPKPMVNHKEACRRCIGIFTAALGVKK